MIKHVALKGSFAKAILAGLILSACATPATPPAPTGAPAAAVEPSAETPIAEAGVTRQQAELDPRALHERLLVMDTHLDTPAVLVRPGFDITKRSDPARDYAQVDLPRMIEGGLDGGFWVIYTPQGPLIPEAYAATYETAIERSEAILEMVETYPNAFALATKAADAAPIQAAGKRIVYQAIENAYPLGEDISNLETFYDLGVRMVGPVHFANNQFADSSTDVAGPKWGGLSPLGVDLVKEANRLGIVLDASHAHDLALRDMIYLSKTPIILSHSGAKAVFDHPRNIDDDLLLELAKNGGVIQMNAFGAYLRALPRSQEKRAAVAALNEAFGPLSALDEAGYDAYLARRFELDAQYPPPQATFDDYMDHFLHVLKLIGPDHVGVGADWDGGGGVVGMEDVTGFPKITERLLAEGYSEEDLAKIWGGNALRLLAAAEAHAASLAGDE